MQHFRPLAKLVEFPVRGKRKCADCLPLKETTGAQNPLFEKNNKFYKPHAIIKLALNKNFKPNMGIWKVVRWGVGGGGIIRNNDPPGKLLSSGLN